MLYFPRSFKFGVAILGQPFTRKIEKSNCVPPSLLTIQSNKSMASTCRYAAVMVFLVVISGVIFNKGHAFLSIFSTYLFFNFFF
jgi:hypothetical protein